MSSNSIEPVYELKSLHSNTLFKNINNQSDIEECIKDIKDGMAIIWLFSEIQTDLIKDGKLLNYEMPNSDKLKYIIKVRFFNESKEWYLWRVEEGLKARLREENEEGTTVEAIDAKTILKSIIADPLKTHGFRGSKIKLIIRNYINYEDNQAGYFDSRFVKFVDE